MAADTSPPRIVPIFVTALIAVSALVGLKFVFDSYYLEMFEAEEYVKNGSVKPKALLELHAAESKSLAQAPIPIDRAMALVAKGRGEPIPGVATDWITPEPSTDNGALVGWAKFGRSAPPAPTASAAPADAAAAAPSAMAAGSGSAAPMGSAPVPANSARPMMPAPSASPSAPASSVPRAPGGPNVPGAPRVPGAPGVPAGTSPGPHP